QPGEQMGRASDMSHRAHGKAQAQAQSAGHQQMSGQHHQQQNSGANHKQGQQQCAQKQSGQKGSCKSCKDSSCTGC
ncbi:hypothetical protein BGX29_000787, partial [Mortierella sp. GBA35]